MKHFSCLGVAMICFATQAQPLEAANAQQIVDQLAPAASPATADRAMGTPMRTRNLKPVQRSVDLVVQFDFDSAQLQSVSKPLLDQLAQGQRVLQQSPEPTQGRCGAKVFD
jgi:outer membrane protein OmpA-like peptidoglycan-associated protein